jgi:hypothetical protein
VGQSEKWRFVAGIRLQQFRRRATAGGRTQWINLGGLGNGGGLILTSPFNGERLAAAV